MAEELGKNKTKQKYLFTDYMIVYPESPRELIKLTQSIKEFSKLVRSKVNIQKFIAFIYKTKARYFSKGPNGGFPVMDLILNNLGSEGHIFSTAIIQLCHFSMGVVTDNI